MKQLCVCLLKSADMQTLMNKRILLGITGGIAAYKSADLVRRLRDAGAEVQVVMTAAATEFVTPLTFQALSGHPVRCDLFDQAAEAAMGHIELARWADAILIAPCSTNTLAKLAQGLGDNLLTTLCLATDAPIALAPAMNRLMWSNPATQANLQLLQQRGIQLFGPGSGSQACGETGEGRMLEPQELAELTSKLFQHESLTGKKLLITAGPTREALDPVRFLSNRSSGKMGFALAEAAAEAGAEVTLIAGPVSLATPHAVQHIDVESAEQMHAAVLKEAAKADIFIGCAAVADYRLAQPATEKIKKDKDSDVLELKLLKNPDILAEVAGLPQRPFCVGFAAETENLIAHAQEKLKRKNLDLIVANTVGPTQGFEQDQNAVEVLWRDGQKSFTEMPKTKLARHIIRLIAKHLTGKTAQTTATEQT